MRSAAPTTVTGTRSKRNGRTDAGHFPVWSAEGARRVTGRWHEAGAEVIYASATYSTAMLEMLAHWNGVPPPNQHFIEITIPKGTSYEVVTMIVFRGFGGLPWIRCST